MQKIKDYMTISQFARKRRVSARSVLRAIHKGEIRAEKCDFFFVIHKSELVRYGSRK